MQFDEERKHTPPLIFSDRNESISSTIFRSRYLVNLLARSQMMMASLEDGDNAAFTYHLHRISEIAKEAELKEVSDSVEKILARIGNSRNESHPQEIQTACKNEIETLHLYIQSLRTSSISHRLN